MGQAPHIFAKAASERIRLVLSPAGHEHLGGDVQADTDGLDQLWGDGLGLGLEMLAVDLDLVVQEQPASGQRAEDVPHGRVGSRERSGGLQPGAGFDELVVGQRFERLTHLLCCRDEGGFERDHRCAAGFHGRVACDLE
jgi:hypothetical protein